MAIPVATKDMKFKYICKYCQKAGLAWKVIDHKWMLFDTIESAHVCQEKQSLIDGKTSNLKTKKVANKKSGFKEHFDKLNEVEKHDAAKKILKKIKEGDNALKAMADKPILMDDSLVPKGDLGSANAIDGLDELPEVIEKTNPKSKKEKVKLIQAEELYQPVYGSSTSSVYYVVALYDGLKFAARVKGGGGTRTVSIRVEGSSYAKLKHMSGLQKFKDNGAYGSIHVNVETVYEAKMLICGLVGGIDLESFSPLPDLTNIAK